jgi:hypothetical protein
MSQQIELLEKRVPYVVSNYALTASGHLRLNMEELTGSEQYNAWLHKHKTHPNNLMDKETLVRKARSLQLMLQFIADVYRISNQRYRPIG